MPKIIFLFLFSCTLLHKGICQQDSGKVVRNAVYLELLGAGGFGSLNYERLILEKHSFRSGIRAGISTSRLKDFQRNFNPDFAVPVSWLLFYGTKHNLELGAGTTIISTIRAASGGSFQPQRTVSLHQHFSIGYRYQKAVTNGFMFRLTYTPVIEYYRFFRHWGGISAGYTF